MGDEDWKEILRRFVSETVTRVSIEPWSVRLLFESGELHVEGPWRLINASQAIVDKNGSIALRSSFELWRLAGKRLLNILFSNEPLPRFVLEIEGQWGFDVMADDDGLDDWSLTYLDQKVFCNGNSITVFS